MIKKWWFWIFIFSIIGALGNFLDTLDSQKIKLNETVIEQNYDNNSKTVSDRITNSNDNNIDRNLVGTWINQTSTYILEKLVLLEDGTGFWDSKSIYWKVEDNMIVFKLPNKTVDYGYRIEDSKLHMSNGCRLIRIDNKQPIKLSSLINTRWIPDFVSYPNNYHVDNPVLKLVYVSNDEEKLTFQDEYGVRYVATKENGWLYLFEDDEMFYSFSIYGLDPEEGYDAPHMFVNVTAGGWYHVTYKLEE